MSAFQTAFAHTRSRCATASANRPQSSARRSQNVLYYHRPSALDWPVAGTVRPARGIGRCGGARHTCTPARVNERSRLAFAIEVFHRVPFLLPSSSSRPALGLSEQLRQPCESTAMRRASFFVRTLACSGLAVPGVDGRERLTVGVADDIAASDLGRGRCYSGTTERQIVRSA
jgi:hypothetical protein